MASSLASGDDAGAAFCASVDAAFRNGSPEAVSDESLQSVLSADVRLYPAKSDERAQELAPLGDKSRKQNRGGHRDLRDHARPQLSDLQCGHRRGKARLRSNKLRGFLSLRLSFRDGRGCA
jgi:hypothetical protein